MDRSIITSLATNISAVALGFLVCFIWLIVIEKVERPIKHSKLTLRDELANRDIYIMGLERRIKADTERSEKQLKSVTLELLEFKTQHQGGGCGCGAQVNRKEQVDIPNPMAHKLAEDTIPTYRYLYEKGLAEKAIIGVTDYEASPNAGVPENWQEDDLGWKRGC